MPTIALFSWPLIILTTLRRLPRDTALICALLSGYLLLPESFGIDLPGLPPIDKASIIAATLLAVAVTVRPQPVSRRAAASPAPINGSPVFGRIVLLMVCMILLSPIATILANGQPLSIGPLFIPGMRAWDFVSILVEALTILLPFLIARRCLASPESHRKLLIALVIAGLAYSLLMLVEMRLSPQLHRWVYGYMQHSFLQHIRGDGYRPMVFLQHGLAVGFFMFSTVLAAFALMKADLGKAASLRWLLIGVWLLVILVLSKNLAATVMAFVFVPLIFLGSVIRMTVVLSLATTVLVYPALRGADILPLDRMLEMAESVSEARAQSLGFRFDHEETLLEKANEKPLTGWGTWGRNRVYDEVTGRDLSVTDGYWIIMISSFGWLRYLAFFGLLTLPIMAMAFVRRRKEVRPETTVLMLIMTATLVNMIPNASVSPFVMMIFGAIAGFVQFDEKAAPSAASAMPMPDRRASSSAAREPRYTRFARDAQAPVRQGAG